MKDWRLSTLGFIHVGPDTILGGADRIVRHSLVVYAGRVFISLVRSIARTVTFDRSDVPIVPVCRRC
jgi:hypothetical protein